MQAQSRTALLLVTTTLATFGAWEAAFAQAAPGGVAEVEEVVVTAQRRSENLQQAPVAVTALSTKTLEDRSVRTTVDLMQVTPGLQVSTQTAGDSGGSATFFLRGMGQQRALNGSEPAVGVYVDDIYYPSLQGDVFSILDLQQVEVLRGPQGTLFGRNTIGGAIRYTTRAPSRDFQAHLQATAGSYGRADVSGSANLPFGDRAAVRFTAGHLQTDGYVRQQNGGDDAGGTTTDLARLALRLDPTEDLMVDLGAQYTSSKLDGFAYFTGGPIAPVPGTLPFTYNHIPPLGGVNPYDNRYASQCDFCQAGTEQREVSRTKTYVLTATEAWTISPELTFKALTGYTNVRSTSHSDLDASPLPIYEPNISTKTEAASQEFQLNGKLASKLDFVGGVYLFDVRGTPGDGPRNSLVLGKLIPSAVSNTETKTYAAYVDGTYHLTDKVALLGGIRYSKDIKDVHTINTATGSPLGAHADFESTTGRIGAQVQWSQDIMTYATISEGFRAGGFSVLTNAIIPFQPEKDTSYEVGGRMEFLDRRLRINPTAFYNKWENIQVQSVVPTPTGVVAVLGNAASAHSYGLEVEAEAAVTEHLHLFGNLATLNIHYDAIGAATGITVDSHFQRAPRLTYALGGRYDTKVRDFGLAATMNYSWEDVQFSTPTDIDHLRLPAYGVLNARIEVTSPKADWILALFGTNLADKTYFIGGVNYAKNVGAAHYDLGRPREFGVSLRHNF
jgi:iron complex outermembrane receptor protein